jgi:hypothetical protein
MTYGASGQLSLSGGWACDNNDARHSPALSLGLGGGARLGQGLLWVKSGRDALKF